MSCPSSVISPALFNIFLEDLSDKLKAEAGIDLEDLIYYSDDFLTICISQEQIKKAIQVISEWSDNNEKLLNRKKSGIIIFANRRTNKIPMIKLLKKEGDTVRN